MTCVKKQNKNKWSDIFVKHQKSQYVFLPKIYIIVALINNYASLIILLKNPIFLVLSGTSHSISIMLTHNLWSLDPYYQPIYNAWCYFDSNAKELFILSLMGQSLKKPKISSTWCIFYIKKKCH